ncbi:hypothetical protein AB9E15_31030 [Rhizobium leguminosarum]|uniref:hypothetical protein n=1 Tax=Rhizobium leguminosarum TaxID=384 RepID=UPI003F943C3F
MATFELGDKVRLVQATAFWDRNPDFHARTGVVTDLVNDGTELERITVSYDGEVKFQGIDARVFAPEEEIVWQFAGENQSRGLIRGTEVATVWAEVDNVGRVLRWHWRVSHSGVTDSSPSSGETNVDEAHARDNAVRAYLNGNRVGNG